MSCKKLLLIAVLISIIPFSSAECAQFYESLNSTDSIEGNGGTFPSGTISFVSGINENAGNFESSKFVHYQKTIFNSQSGTISFWFKKNSSNAQGGLVQIGKIGENNSLGVFYANTNIVYFEIKKDASNYKTIWANNAVSQSGYTHIAATWDLRGTSYAMKLFINGKPVSWDFFYNTIQPQTFLDIGLTGAYGTAQGAIDEVRFFNRQLSDADIYAEYVFSSNKFAKQPAWKPVSSGNVRIIDQNLFVRGHDFTIKGVGYQPVPFGSINDRATLDYIYSNPAILQRDMNFLRSMRVNTVRLWAQLADANLLDALYNNGYQPIYAIMAFEVPSSGIDYSSLATIAKYENDINAFVTKFKTHPAVLAWGIGNENNLHYTGNVADWYLLAGLLAKKAYEVEGPAYHPTMIINGLNLDFGNRDLNSDDVSLEYVDLWGHNSYTGYSFGCYFDYYKNISSKPLVLTEFGIDAYDSVNKTEYQQTQADWEAHQWNEIKSNSLGGTVMAYSDEWWKAGTPLIHNSGGYYTDVQPDGISDEEYWGLFSIQDSGSLPDLLTPRKNYFALRNEFYKGAILPDFDWDNDVDQSDFGAFQVCYNGSGPVLSGCENADFDRDNHVDLNDFAIFQACSSGPMVPVPAECEQALYGGLELQPLQRMILNEDSDRDNVLEIYDTCPATPHGAEVDSKGCSAGQFCSAIKIDSPKQQQLCSKADWKSNEAKKPMDCTARKESKNFFSCIALPAAN